MTTSTSLSITFGGETSESVTQSYSLEVDSDYFETVNGESKSTYLVSDEVFLKCIPPSSVEPYTLHSSIGILTKVHSDILFETTETLLFKKSTTATLGNIPYSIISSTWIGGDKGSVSFSGATATVSSEIVGILEVTYMAKGDRLSLTGCTSDQEEFEVLCLAEYTSEMSDTTVSFEAGEETGTTNVTLLIRDVITGEPLPDASVQVTGSIGLVFSGNANSNGEVELPDLIKGERYGVQVTATGYFASSEDYLNNDSFTVPED